VGHYPVPLVAGRYPTALFNPKEFLNFLTPPPQDKEVSGGGKDFTRKAPLTAHRRGTLPSPAAAAAAATELMLLRRN
jgi:hypothetical protein